MIFYNIKSALLCCVRNGALHLLLCLALGMTLPAAAMAQANTDAAIAQVHTGPAIGDSVPAFRLTDQMGIPQDLSTLAGPRGTILVFFRSADWCPDCKNQLVELQQSRPILEELGLGLGAISKDSPMLLKLYGKRKKITFPLLADPRYDVIRRYDILDYHWHESELRYGVSFPGIYVLDAEGKVRSKYFQDRFPGRVTARSILVRDFDWTPNLPGTAETDALAMRYGVSDDSAYGGSHVTLILDIWVKEGMRIYGPGAEGKTSISLQLTDMPLIRVGDIEMPDPVVVSIPATGDSMPTFSGHFRILQDIQLGDRNLMTQILGNLQAGDTGFPVRGVLTYQASDTTREYPPREIPLELRIGIKPNEL